MKLKGLLKIALVLLAVSSLFVACDTIAGGKWPRVEKVYMKPSEDWADGRFAVWFWETGKEGSFTDMKASTEYEGLYEVNVPAGVDNVIFVKMSADSKENSWDNKEAQTGDLQVPILGDGGAVYSITAKQWIELGAKEPEPEPEPEEPVDPTVFTHLCGTFDNWGEHKKLDNKTFTFTATKAKEEFKFTTGKWEGDGAYEAYGCTVSEFGKEYELKAGKCGVDGRQNIKINNLTVDNIYKITLIVGNDNKLSVKVELVGQSTISPEVYKYSIPLEKIGGMGNPDTAKLIILTMTDEQVAAKKLEDSYKATGDVAIYTHESGSFSVKGVDNFAAVITDTDLTLYYKVPSAKVEEGKKPYLFGLVSKANDETNFVFSDWEKDVMKMTKVSLLDFPTNLKENSAPAGAPIYIAGGMNGWNTTANPNTVTFYATGDNVEFKVIKSGEWIGHNASISIDPESHESGKIKLVGGGNIQLTGLTKNNEYTITVTEESGDIYVEAKETGNKKEWESLATMYFNPGSWLDYDGYVYLWIFDDNDSSRDKWIEINSLSKVEGKDYYSLDVDNYTGVVFVRHTAATEPNDRWTSPDKQYQTQINALEGNYFVINGWDGYSWTTLE